MKAAESTAWPRDQKERSRRDERNRDSLKRSTNEPAAIAGQGPSSARDRTLNHQIATLLWAFLEQDRS